MNWFVVDKAGLSKLLIGRGKAFIVHELVQNAWDQNVTRVDVTIEPVPGKPLCRITVEDDDPDGFEDLRDAYTLFAESKKKGNAEQRGRFNLGEKLVLAVCKTAELSTTKGMIWFGSNGRTSGRSKRGSGTRFTAEIPMKRAEIDETIAATLRLIPPVKTIVNGQELQIREPVCTFDVSLPTVMTDDEGVLRQRMRRTVVSVYATADGETATLYELGIPVVETGDKYHVDIAQKVPLNMNRDNVQPSYLRAIRTYTLNHTVGLLSDGEATDHWVREACSDKRIEPGVIRATIHKRFGSNAVVYDPSDPEANKISASEGRQLIYGRMLTKGEWSNIRQAANVLPPAGQVTPSPKPYSATGDPLNVIDESDWTLQQRRMVAFIRRMAARLIDRPGLPVVLVSDIEWSTAATYGKGSELVINVAAVGQNWFAGLSADSLGLIVHEFAHEYESDHLSRNFYRQLQMIGGLMTRLALDEPGLFKL